MESLFKMDIDVNNWFKFYNMSVFLVCVGVFESYDFVSFYVLIVVFFYLGKCVLIVMWILDLMIIFFFYF